MSGAIAIVAGIIALAAFVALIATGLHAVRNEGRMISTDEGKHIVAAFTYSVICAIATVIFFVAGIVWVIEQFT